MKTCPKCKVHHEKNGTFCSRKCANSRTWTEADKEKKRNAIHSSEKFKNALVKIKEGAERGRQTQLERGYVEKNKPISPLIEIVCPVCGISKTTRQAHAKKYCSAKCFNVANKERCNTPEERARLRDIGRKGGFGKKGYTTGGTYYQSSIEKRCFELLEQSGIEFEAHKHLPNSTKVSDCYLPSRDLWIEIDGIDRDKRKKWLESEYNYWVEKISQYKEQDLNFVIVKSFNEFSKVIKNT